MANPVQGNALAPALSKRAVSLFFRVGCERQFLLYLYSSDPARAQLGMPPRQGGRAGLGLVGRHGYGHQAEKVRELQTAFGDNQVRVGAVIDANTGRTQRVDLLGELCADIVRPYSFVVEANFGGGFEATRAALRITDLTDLNGNQLDFHELIPDLVQILPPLAQHLTDDPSLDQAYREEILPDGRTAVMNPAEDARLRLRVADVKLSSEPGAHYFAEVVFYSMLLAGWLRDNNLHNRFAVIAAPAVMPGSMETSHLVRRLHEWDQVGHRPQPFEATIALEDDLEIAPVEAFAPRIRDLVSETLPRLLRRRWQDAPFHVDFRCQGCEFLGDPHIRDRNGQPTQHALHCWPEAERSAHLSRVVGLSRGASDVLRANQVANVADLSAVVQPPEGTPPVPFQQHHGLRSRRTVFPARAQALQQDTSSVIPNSGGDALMPRWPDLHIYIFLDYDPATSFTVALGCRAFWREPLPFGSPLQPATQRWGRAQGDTEVFLIDRPTLADERREFLRFLRYLREIFRWVFDHDDNDERAGRRNAKTRRSTYQIYLWDEAQRRHFVRLVSRHLGAILADANLRQLAWLFPPPELLANPDNESRRTPYTLVHSVVQNTVAVARPHHYTLIEVARAFNVTNMTAPTLHPLYTDTFSNLAPPERIHEFWNRVDNWQQRQGLLVETVHKKLFALGIVVAGLERELGPVLSRLAAPPLPVVPNRIAGLAIESYLWIEFTRLNGALEGLDVDRVRAMPPHERESKFQSARLVRRLRGNERLQAWALVQQQNAGLPPLTGRILIYELAPDSRDFSPRPGDFNFALAPSGDHGFLDRHPYTVLANAPVQYWGSTIDEASLTAVNVVAVDRINGRIALEADQRSRLPQLRRYAPQIDLDRNVMIDPTNRDFLTRKVEMTFRGIGNPPCARPTPRLCEALGIPANQPAGTDAIEPGAEVIWQPDQLYARASVRDITVLRPAMEQRLAAAGIVLMQNQWAAWEHALARQFALVWGPPGTGKSRTLRSIIWGAVLDAVLHERSLRVLVTANTYTAVDNVLLALHADLRTVLAIQPGARLPYELIRLQSSKRPPDPRMAQLYPDLAAVQLDRAAPNRTARNLVQSLDRAQGIIVVGAPAQQVHNLAVPGQGRRPQLTQRPWFDLIILDEASQMDVATSSLVFSKRAPGGTCVLAGDDLQLPPIHQADAPEGLEDLVGSVYNYMRRERGVNYHALDVTFRSNETLIAFTREAGYDPSLRAHSPALRLNIDQIPDQRPADWPADLPWSEDYSRVLNPDHSAVCLVYDDRQSAQSNAFEAGHITSLVSLLRLHLKRGLLNELDPFGRVIDDGRATMPVGCTADQFWDDGVGVVVPHRAQMALIASQLRRTFPADPQEKIVAAVDTVERFQGQQRDVIIAAFGLGDPDIIAAEEEFLYSLNRFNVMASRARAKLIVMVSRTIIQHLSDDSIVLTESLLLKRFAEQFCVPAPDQYPNAPWELRWR